jgi:hypothetical protein
MLAPQPAQGQSFSGGPVTIVDSATPPRAAAPFPSQVTVPASVAVTAPDGTTREEPIGIVRTTRLRLNDLSHDFPSDVDVLLVGPDGKSVLLLSDAGPSGAATNVVLLLDDQATGPVPDPLTSGVFLPTDLGSRASAISSHPRPLPARTVRRYRYSPRPIRSGPGACISLMTILRRAGRSAGGRSDWRTAPGTRCPSRPLR